MAYIGKVHCITCGETKCEIVDRSNPNQCAKCCAEARDRAEREWKAGREGLTLEERIRELENFMYHHSKYKHYNPIVFG